MKKLTINEKAKRYDEAIEIAGKIYNEHKAQPFDVMLKVFPELKSKDKDEKIRKALIDFFNKGAENGEQTNGVCDKDIRAWLEKQGMPVKYHDICDTCVRQPTCQSDCFLQQSEQKQEVEGNPNARKPTLRIIKGKSYLCIKDYRDKNCTFTKGKIYESDKDGFLVDDEEKDTFERKIWEEDAIEYFFLFEQSKPKNIVTDKKQKPSDKVEPKFKVGDKIYLKPEYRMPDDDTPIANTVFEIRAIDDKYYRFDGSYIFIEDQDKYELVEQKPAWSEEDELMLTSIIQTLKLTNGATQMKIDWLKSLRPKSQWKPSDKQMKSLEEACDKHWEPDGLDPLYTLYQDLKKLKG